ncbi:MAG TPA: protein-disulfide reductase DsbD N-terminal domain-containing protein [Vicinamibacterales bacterium]|nr:protein-disulfide reductase DsbD N-terminal domain-containing protein [Vicinamibacterales bacterium]
MNLGRAFTLPPLAAAAVLVLAALSFAQSPPQPVTWSVALEPAAASAPPGGRLTLAVKATIAEGWHVYGADEVADGPRPLRIALAPEQPFKAGKLEAPEPTRDFDVSFKQVVAFYTRPTTFKLPVTVSSTAGAGETQIRLEVVFQACDGRVCLPGRTARLSVPIRIAGGH